MFPELFHIPTQSGVKKVSINISPSFIPTVYFDFYKDGSIWKVYWILGKSSTDLVTLMREFASSSDTFQDVYYSPDFRKAVVERTPVSSRIVGEDMSLRLEGLCKDGLPQPARKAQGLDGTTFEIEIDGFTDVFSFWTYLPEEWNVLKGVIDPCVEFAGLDGRRYGCR